MIYSYPPFGWSRYKDAIHIRLDSPFDDVEECDLILSWNEGLDMAERLIQHSVCLIEPHLKQWSDRNGVSAKRFFQEQVFRIRSFRKLLEDDLPRSSGRPDMTRVMEAPLHLLDARQKRAKEENAAGHTDAEYSLRVRSLYNYAESLEGEPRRFAESFAGFLTGMNEEAQPELFTILSDDAECIRRILRAIWTGR